MRIIYYYFQQPKMRIIRSKSQNLNQNANVHSDKCTESNLLVFILSGHLWTLWMHQIWFYNALDHREDATKAIHHQKTIAQNIHTILTIFARNPSSVLCQKSIKEIQRELIAQNINSPWNMCREKCLIAIPLESMQLKKQNQHWLSSIARWN